MMCTPLCLSHLLVAFPGYLALTLGRQLLLGTAGPDERLETVSRSRRWCRSVIFAMPCGIRSSTKRLSRFFSNDLCHHWTSIPIYVTM